MLTGRFGRQVDAELMSNWTAVDAETSRSQSLVWTDKGGARV